MVDLERDLRHHQCPVLEQQVIGLQHTAGLRILYRDEAEVDRLVGHPMEGVAQRPKRARRRRGKGGVQSLLGVGARFPLIADRDLAGDARHFNTLLG